MGKMQQLVAEDGCEQCVCREVKEDSPEKVASVQRSEGTKGTNETGYSDSDQGRTLAVIGEV